MKFARANEILVVPLHIVFIQSSVKDVLCDVYQMKEEKQSFPYMHNLLRKSVIMIENSFHETRFRFFWDALYMIMID